MILNHTNLDFLKSRISEIKSAIFNDLTESPSKFSTCIISSLEVDNLGNIWFLMAKNGRHLQFSDLYFPARLSFYRKGHSFSLNITGRGFIVNNAEAISRIVGLNEVEQKARMDQALLVKVEISSAEYLEWAVRSPKSALKRFWNQLLTWFHLAHKPAPQLAVYSIN
ncbi:MAG: hypothetical protein C5B52_14485 [Bacteroidetes bacterium]|nr:MAG: hypothetical protein C5B52_14485 [Bacteroidota bacterium]